jgi:hypothetical protein
MLSKNPITVDDVVYDHLTISLAVSSRFNPDGTASTSIALRAVPTAITPEGVKTLDAQPKTAYRGSLAELRSEDERSCVNAMASILAAWIHEQGW